MDMRAAILLFGGRVITDPNKLDISHCCYFIKSLIETKLIRKTYIFTYISVRIASSSLLNFDFVLHVPSTNMQKATIDLASLFGCCHVLHLYMQFMEQN